MGQSGAEKSTTLVNSVQAASTLAAFVGERAAEIESGVRLPEDVASAIKASGLLRLLTPSILGGNGGAWRPALYSIETVAQADGSTGWSLMIGMVGNMLTGYLRRDEALNIFSPGSDHYLAGVFEPRGIAHQCSDSDRLRLSGRWRFATGIHLSDWCCVGALIRTGDEREVRQFVLPTKDIKIISNWDVLGLSGTGSDDIELEPKEIERRRSFTFSDVPWPDEWLWRVPFFSVAASLMAACILGMARSALNSVLEKGASSDDSLHGFRQNRCFEVEVARAEATVRAARSFLSECVEGIESKAQRGIAPPERERALLWLAAIHASRSCNGVLDLLFTGEGASVIRRESSLQRRWRDVRAAGQHVLIARQRLEAIGRVLLGAPAEARPFL